MAVTDQQKLDFLLKKIGYTKTKTGSVVGTGAISGTPKQPFAEAIPSPLIIANGALWNESGSIPTIPPGSDTAQVKVYLAASSGLRMTADSTSSGQRAFIAYSTYGNSSSTRLTNWIDTQFGSAYLIKVYKGDPNSGGVALSAAGSGANDGWFFDYSAGVLNFNDTSVPSGVTDTNIYIVGYRYIGLTGAPTPTGGGNFTFNDLVVSNNFQVGGISTFNGLVDINAGGQANTFKVEDLTDNRIVIAGTGGELEDSANLTFDGSTLGVTGDATFSGNVSIGGTLTYEDVVNVDSVGIVTAQAGIRVTGGVIEALAGENKIPSLYAAMGNLPSAGSYHGMFAHVHATGRGYFAHAGNWYELVNKEVNGVVGTGTETYNIGNLVSVSSTATSFNVTGVTTVVTLDVNGDVDVDGHTNLDNVSVAGVSTFNDDVKLTGASYSVLWDKSENALEFSDDARTTFGDSKQLKLYRNSAGSSSTIENTQDQLNILNSGTHTNITAGSNIYLKHGTNHAIVARANAEVEIYHNAQEKLATTSTGINVIGNVVSDGLVVDGNSDLNGDLDVDGHTNLDNVSISGVTSVASLTSGRVVTVGTAGKLQDSNNLTFDGSNLFVSGINITGGGATSILGADIVTRNLKATGLSTFVGQSEFDGNAKFDSTITAGGSAGSNGQYLKTTGSGVEWASFPTLRTSQTFTASSGQTTFSFSYTVGFLDVFVNGVKLASSEFTATNGVSVVLAVGSFVGDIVELISYYTVSGGGGGGGGGISNVVEDTTPELGGNLDLFNKSITGTGNVNITGIITATNFVGDGSGLTGVTASGSGVIVKDSGSVVGTAQTIDFGSNLSVSPASAGIVTITAAGISTNNGVVSVVNDLDVDGHTNLDNVSIAGVVTATTFVGALTGNATGLSGNPSINITDLDVDGHTNLDNVSIAGITTFSNDVNVSSGQLIVATSIKKTSGTLDINANAISLNNAAASATYATFSNGGAAVLKWNNTDRLETTTSGVTVTGTVAATSYTGDGSQLTGIGAGSTANIITNNLQVLGISTFIGIATFAGEVQTGTGATVGIGSTAYVHKIAFTEAGSSSSTLNAALGESNSKLTFTGNGVQNGVWGNTGLKIAGNGSSTTTGPESNCSLEVVSSENTKVLVIGNANAQFELRSNAGNGQENIIRSNKALDFVTGTGAYSNVFRVGESEGSSFFHSVGISSSPTGNKTITLDSKSGIVTATKFVGDGSQLTNLPGGGSYGNNDVDNHLNVSGASSGQILSWNGSDYDWVADQTGGGGGTDVGITTNLSGSFTASAGTPATINTFAYHDNDKVVEYTVYIKNGSDFQTQKLLAMRDGTTIHSTQFAVIFSSSLLVQCDATISSGNILLRATPETGVSGSTTYKIKREVM